jgi:hypothetical protein
MAEGAEKPVLEVLKGCLAGLRGNVTADGQASLDMLEGLPKRLKISKAASDDAHKALLNVRGGFYRTHRRLGRGESGWKPFCPLCVPNLQRSAQSASQVQTGLLRGPLPSDLSPNLSQLSA